MHIEDHIRDIPDFPKQGIVFKDITPLLGNPTAFTETAQALQQLVGDQPIDKVVGIESRGFFFGTLLAQHFGAGFVPVRKHGKLPYDRYTQSYDLEYGTDAIEMHQDAIQEGDRVLLHDDVLATGGTAAAAVKLIEQAGGKVIQCNFLLELSFLQGREKLPGYSIAALQTY